MSVYDIFPDVPRTHVPNRNECLRDVMIPIFVGIGIGIGPWPQKLESESHGIDSKLESIPSLESVPRLESIPSMELIHVLKKVQQIICVWHFFQN